MVHRHGHSHNHTAKGLTRDDAATLSLAHDHMHDDPGHADTHKHGHSHAHNNSNNNNHDHGHDYGHGHDHNHDHNHNHVHGHDHDHGHDHGHGHGHGGCDSHSHRGWRQYAPHSHSVHTRLLADKRALVASLVIQFLAFSIQLIGAVRASSTLLGVEALHTFVDAVTILLSLISVIVATKRPNSRHTYGFGRAEILSALLSLMALLMLCFKLLSSAVTRIISVVRGSEIDEVKGGIVVFAETVTLVANILTAAALSTSAESLNMRAARAHVIADSIENIVVLLAGVVLYMVPKWAVLDPVLSVFVIGLLIALNWRISVETVDVVMQAAPQGMVRAICTRIEKEFPDVGIAQPHVWTLTTGVVVGSLKLSVSEDAGSQYVEGVRAGVSKIMAEAGVHQSCVEVRLGRDNSDADDDNIVHGGEVTDGIVVANGRDANFERRAQLQSSPFSIVDEDYERLPSGDSLSSVV